MSAARDDRRAGIASIHDSGGERALLVDLAADLGVPFAQISDATTARIQAALDPGLEAANPLDAWGTGHRRRSDLRGVLPARCTTIPTRPRVAFVVDLTRQGEPYDEGYLQVAREVFAATTKPFCVLSNLASAVANDEAALLRDAGSRCSRAPRRACARCGICSPTGTRARGRR